MSAVSDAVSVCWRHPPNATESLQRNIPLEPARAGAQDGSTIDNTATDPGTDTTTSKNTTHETTTAAAGHSLQVCPCGWEKITSARGLKIHQGKRGCLGKQRQGTHIDQYFLRSNQSNLSIEAQRQEKNKVRSASAPLSLRTIIQAQKCQWRNPPNHRDLPRRIRSKGTDRV